jgi:hypothetical protein
MNTSLHRESLTRSTAEGHAARRCMESLEDLLRSRATCLRPRCHLLMEHPRPALYWVWRKGTYESSSRGPGLFADDSTITRVPVRSVLTGRVANAVGESDQISTHRSIYPQRVGTTGLRLLRSLRATLSIPKMFLLRNDVSACDRSK